MSRIARRAVPIYLGLLLLVSAAGLVNQALYRHQTKLIDARAKLMGQVANLRLGAAAIDGPLAVTQWADAHGMVPAPEASQLSAVAAGPTRAPAPPDTGLEIRTVWH
ncbi:MAG TPA: hypothetical protein VKB31_03135 [Trueperaceae bacterium]|nr:hypothetical protein [Trueperaceae bacterium]